MYEGSDGYPLGAEGVVAIHGSGALEYLQLRALTCEPLPGFLGHSEALILASSDDDGLRAILDKLPNVVDLRAGGVVRPCLVPVPTAASPRP